MIILESGFGNLEERFVENRYTNGINVVYSNDNNKGKTLVVQGLMYALGNDPIFPEGFNFRDYFFYIKFITAGKTWIFLRKNNSFIVRNDGNQNFIESVSELKRFITTYVFHLPSFKKDDRLKIADPALFYQLFFIPQDNRNTSDIIGGGYFNKRDFYEMLYATTGEEVKLEIDGDTVTTLESQIAILESELANQKKYLKFARKNPRISEIANKHTDRLAYMAQKEKIARINTRMSENKKRRSKETSNHLKLENLVQELKSLNRELSTGTVECGDCHSENIIFKNKDYIFDISNDYVRKTVLESIGREIDLKAELINEIQREINSDQVLLERELEGLPTDIRTAMFNFEDVLTDAQIGKKVQDLVDELESKKEELRIFRLGKLTKRSNDKDLVKRIVDRMQAIYRGMDPDGRIEFVDLFSKRGVVYSGSEGMEFYFAKLVAIKEELHHEFPIIIDSFRDGELSTNKEQYALEILSNLGAQSILTATVKAEEYDSQIYSSNNLVNAIDYSSNTTSKILSKSNPEYFGGILSLLGLANKTELP
jgi:hypothetical protein